MKINIPDNAIAVIIIVIPARDSRDVADHSETHDCADPSTSDDVRNSSESPDTEEIVYSVNTNPSSDIICATGSDLYYKAVDPDPRRHDRFKSRLVPGCFCSSVGRMSGVSVSHRCNSRGTIKCRHPVICYVAAQRSAARFVSVLTVALAAPRPPPVSRHPRRRPDKWQNKKSQSHL